MSSWSSRLEGEKRLALFLGDAVEDYANFFQGDQSALDHFVETGENGVDAFLRFDDLDNNGQVLREAKNLVGVVDARAAKTGYAAQDGRAGEAFLAEHLDDGLRERLSVPFIGFTDVNAHQGALAFEFFVGLFVGHDDNS